MSASAKHANRDQVLVRLTELFTRWRQRGVISSADPRVLAELSFGVVEAALRECYARGKAPRVREEIYITEVARCLRALLGLKDQSRS